MFGTALPQFFIPQFTSLLQMSEVQHCPCKLFQDQMQSACVNFRCTAPYAVPRIVEGNEIYDTCGKPLGAHPTREGNKINKLNDPFISYFNRH